MRLLLTSLAAQNAAIVSIGEEPALSPSRLSEEWLRHCFSSNHSWEPELTKEKRFTYDTQYQPASVLILLVVREHGINVVLTQRSIHLHHHAGQISFPGGRVDVEDTSPTHTALREAQEEIGLDSKKVDVLGMLPLYFTGTGFVVTPVVAMMSSQVDFTPEANEVEVIFEVPLAFLMDPRNHQRRTLHVPQLVEPRLFYAIPYQEYFIWGATAGMLRNLFHLLRA